MNNVGLAASGVSFSYDRRGATRANCCLDDVTAIIPQGGIVGILGPNGSGKTTLLRLMAGLQQPWTGQVTLDGTDLNGLGRIAIARRLAVVPQETQLAF